MNKRIAILITGFQNWGKTQTIEALFNRQRFYLGREYPISSIPGYTRRFIVESHSNDDWGMNGFINSIRKRINKATVPNADLLAAFCPTRELYNNSSDILNEPTFSVFQEIHIIFLEYKYDNHARLQIPIIERYLAANVNNPSRLIFHSEVTAQLGNNGLIDHNIRLANIRSIISQI